MPSPEGVGFGGLENPSGLLSRAGVAKSMLKSALILIRLFAQIYDEPLLERLEFLFW